MSRRTKARSRGLPAWYKGRLIRENYSAFWYGDREGKLFEQEGKLVDKQNYDSITDRERAEELKRRMS